MQSDTMKSEETRDESGQVQHALVHDVQTGTLKKIPADKESFRKAVPSTHELNKKPRKFPRE